MLQLERHPGIEDGTLSIMADWSSTPYGGMCVYYVTSTRQAWSSSAVVFDMAPPHITNHLADGEVLSAFLNRMTNKMM